MQPISMQGFTWDTAFFLLCMRERVRAIRCVRMLLGGKCPNGGGGGGFG